MTRLEVQGHRKVKFAGRDNLFLVIEGIIIVRRVFCTNCTRIACSVSLWTHLYKYAVLGSILFASTISTISTEKKEKKNIHQPTIHQINHPPSRLIRWTEKTLHNVTGFLEKSRQKSETKIFHQPVLFFSEKLADMVDLVDQKNGPLIKEIFSWTFIYFIE